MSRGFWSRVTGGPGSPSAFRSEREQHGKRGYDTRHGPLTRALQTARQTLQAPPPSTPPGGGYHTPLLWHILERGQGLRFWFSNNPSSVRAGASSSALASSIASPCSLLFRP